MKKKKIIVFFSAFLCLTLIAVTCLVLSHKDRIVLRVGDTAVTESEFLMIFENEVRAMMLAEVADKNIENAWEFEKDGKTLKDRALDTTCDKALSYAAQQKLFEKYGVFEWNRKTFKDMYSKKLKNAYSDKQIQYGAQNYSEYDYYVYLHSVYRIDTEKKMLKSASGQEIYDFYIANPDMFKDTDTYVFERYGVDKSKENARKLLEKAVEGDASDDVSVTKITLDAYTSKYDEALSLAEDLGEDINRMRYVGAGIFKENENELLYIKTLEFTEGGIREYKTCGDFARERYGEYKFDKELSGIKAKLKPEKTKYYKRIKLY